ncbi:MAG: glycosyltransferase family 39 protein [Pseudomonadota bacterium]|nr:glycosyltransferase family 39 protein [Pseudomonadota bacterium]
MLILIIIIGIFLRFFMLTHQSFWFDEGVTFFTTHNLNLLENIIFYLNAQGGDRFQPLYFLLMPYWRWVLGHDEWALRTFSAFFGALTVIVLSLIALQIYGKTRQTLWVSALATVSAFAVFYSQDARPYALSLFLATAQTYFLLKGWYQNDDKISRWGFWITLLLASFSTIIMGLFTTALALSHLLVYRQWKRWLTWWAPAILFALPALLYYFSLENSTDPTQISVTRHGFPLLQNILFAFYGITVGLTYGPSVSSLHTHNRWEVVFNYLPHLLILAVVLFFIAFFIIKILFKKQIHQSFRQAHWFLATLLIVAFVLTVIFTLLTKINWLPRHSFYLWIPIILLIPAISLFEKKSGYFTHLLLVSLIILNSFSLINYYFDPVYRKDDFRGVAQYLNTHQDPQVAAVTLWGSDKLFDYYGAQVLKGYYLSNKHFAEELTELIAPRETVFLIVNNEFFWEKRRKTTIKNLMTENYILESTKLFPNFKIYRFTLKDSHH